MVSKTPTKKVPRTLSHIGEQQLPGWGQRWASKVTPSSGWEAGQLGADGAYERSDSRRSRLPHKPRIPTHYQKLSCRSAPLSLAKGSATTSLSLLGQERCATHPENRPSVSRNDHIFTDAHQEEGGQFLSMAYEGHGFCGSVNRTSDSSCYYMQESNIHPDLFEPQNNVMSSHASSTLYAESQDLDSLIARYFEFAEMPTSQSGYDPRFIIPNENPPFPLAVYNTTSEPLPMYSVDGPLKYSMADILAAGARTFDFGEEKGTSFEAFRLPQAYVDPPAYMSNFLAWDSSIYRTSSPTRSADNYRSFPVHNPQNGLDLQNLENSGSKGSIPINGADVFDVDRFPNSLYDRESAFAAERASVGVSIPRPTLHHPIPCRPSLSMDSLCSMQTMNSTVCHEMPLFGALHDGLPDFKMTNTERPCAPSNHFHHVGYEDINGLVAVNTVRPTCSPYFTGQTYENMVSNVLGDS